MELSPYRLTIVAAVVVVILSAGMVMLFGGPQAAAPYLTLVGSIAIPALLSLARSEANAQKVDRVENLTEERHATNVAALDELRAELQKAADAK